MIGQITSVKTDRMFLAKLYQDIVEKMSTGVILINNTRRFSSNVSSPTNNYFNQNNEDGFYISLI